jgi:FMN phosphatase YigB (HAD superfamily)
MRSLDQYKVLAFDCYGTLIDCQTEPSSSAEPGVSYTLRFDSRAALAAARWQAQAGRSA